VSDDKSDQFSGPVRLERPATGGAVGRLDDGRVVFVRHGLPGELVRVAVTESTSKFSRGDAVEVLEASPGRVVPPCRYAHPGGCGGCDLQDASAEEQISWKSSLVTEHLRRIAGVEHEISVTQPASEPQGSRNSPSLCGRRRPTFAARRAVARFGHPRRLLDSQSKVRARLRVVVARCRRG